MKIKAVILIFLIIFSAAARVQAATNEGYGEDSAALGQFVDSFEDLENVSVAVNVVRNSTSNAMELNFTISANWLTGWTYRKEHTIIGTAVGVQTDYPIGIKTYYGAGADGSETVGGAVFGKVYVDSKSEIDFGDVRFTKSDGMSLLDYWIEERVNSSYALFWVEIDSIPASPDNITIYVYYGKTGESTTSNIFTTFTTGDDFNDASVNGSIWTTYAGNPSEQGGYLRVEHDGTREKIKGDVTFGPFGVRIKFRRRFLDLQKFSFVSGFANTDTLGDDYVRFYDSSAEDWLYSTRNEGATTTQTGGNENTNWFKFEATWESGEVKFYRADALKFTIGTNVPNEVSYMVFWASGAAGGQQDIDWVFIGKMTFPEPTHTSWGSEEAAGGYAPSGYFTTVDYLSNPLTNGSALVAMINTTIPANTQILVEFSEDNSTWVFNDWAPLFGGFESVDLRDLNYSSGYHTRFNLSTSDPLVTPRVLQNRVITTLGNASIITESQNITGEWIEYRASAINASIGLVDGGDLNSTFEIDGDTFNVSEVVGAPGMLLSINFTGIDPDAECVWVSIWYLYDGNLNHVFNIEMWNFTSSSWVEDGLLVDTAVFVWVNSTIYALRIPNEFLSGGEVRVRLNHETPGNINHDLFIDYIRLIAKVPSTVAVTAEEFQFFWIVLAIALTMIILMIAKMWFEEGDP